MSVLRSMLHEDLKAATLAKETNRANVIKVILGELDRGTRFMEDPQMIQELKKMHKRATENLQYGGRLAEESKLEIAILDKYLPKQLTTQEMDDLIQKVLMNNIELAVKMKNGDNAAKGQLMKMISGLFAGRGDNKYAATRLPELFHIFG